MATSSLPCAAGSRRRLSTLDSRTRGPDALQRLPCPWGSRLVREWHGRSYTVEVSEDGFLYEGHRYRSLSNIARKITGRAGRDGGSSAYDQPPTLRHLHLQVDGGGARAGFQWRSDRWSCPHWPCGAYRGGTRGLTCSHGGQRIRPIGKLRQFDSHGHSPTSAAVDRGPPAPVKRAQPLAVPEPSRECRQDCRRPSIEYRRPGWQMNFRGRGFF